MCFSWGTVASWEGDGLTVYFPKREGILAAIRDKKAMLL
jgi:hypothetical protein